MSAPVALSEPKEPAAASPPKFDMADLKRKSVRGGMMTMVAQGVSTVIHLASTVTLARLLSPDDYGMIAMVVAITSFAGLFRDLGLSAAAIQKGKLTHAQMSNLFWINVGMGVLLTVLLAAASPLVAWFYDKPELLPLTILLSTTFLISSLGTQHGALMQRELQFGRKAIAAIVGSLTTLAVAVVLAMMGNAYWSLAWGTIAGGIVTTFMLFVLSPFRPGLWTSGAGVRSMLKFGANVTTFELVNYFHRNLDNMLLGKVWGAELLGVYGRAYSLLMFPIQAIRSPINAVALPALSRLLDQPHIYRAYYRKVTHVLALLSMPIVAFMVVASSPIVKLLLGEKWLGVVPVFSILGITAFIQPVAGLRGLVLLSSGNGSRLVAWGVVNAACTSLGFVIGVYWGACGIATSYAIVNYALLFPSLQYVLKGTPLVPLDFLQSISAPALASIGATLVCYCLAFFINSPGAVSPFLHIVLLASIFATSFVGFFCLSSHARRDLAEVVQFLQSGKIEMLQL